MSKTEVIEKKQTCLYQEVEKWENVTVTILRCKRCGHIEIEWEPQEDTRRLL